jgi:hypothetical protein
MAAPCLITTAAPAARPNFGVLPSPEALIQQPQNWYSGPFKCHKQAHIVRLMLYWCLCPMEHGPHGRNLRPEMGGCAHSPEKMK